MGLRALFEKAAQTAFKVAGDVPVWCMYRQDRSDDLEQDKPVEFAIQVLFGSISQLTINTSEDILPNDCTGTVITQELKVTPERGDRVMTLDGREYRVIDSRVSAANILTWLHLRAL